MIVTIDGPAASGKSTAARRLAERLGVSFLDTGAMYRAVTLAATRAGVELEDEEALLGILAEHEFEFVGRHGQMVAYLDGVDVSEEIRDPEVTANARYIAGAAKVREKLVQMQRDFAALQDGIVTEGRDQGTVAFADADVKLFLVADAAERAKRRQADLLAKGRKESLGDIQKAIEARDRSDENRETGPLRAAEDAIMVDTTDLSIEEVVEKLVSCVKAKCSDKD
jgi:cytidylate kinase